jgi:hypothetical protein
VTTLTTLREAEPQWNTRFTPHEAHSAGTERIARPSCALEPFCVERTMAAVSRNGPAGANG